jgi:shikimate dehydrogenase
MTIPQFRMAGVIGWPVTHSRSPALHRYWLDHYGIDGAYLPLPVAPANLPAALRGLSALGFAGANVTIPHKQQTATLMDRMDDGARRLGAVNLVIVEPDGSLTGRNTDGYGFIESLRATIPGWRAPAVATILGAGGAARSIIDALLQAGVGELRLANRTRARADELRAEFGARVLVVDWNNRAGSLAGCGLLVNSTSQGMVGQPALEIDLAALPDDSVVCDIVYNPLVTPLLAAAVARGNPVVDGLGMLLHQARPAFAAWFGVDPEVTDQLRAAVIATLAG